jgi:hypothetical protein
MFIHVCIYNFETLQKNVNNKFVKNFIHLGSDLCEIYIMKSVFLFLHIKGTNRTGRRRKRLCKLSELLIADNQLGWLSGYGLAAYIKNNHR